MSGGWTKTISFTCEVCRCSFVSKEPSQKYCSRDCYYESIRRRPKAVLSPKEALEKRIAEFWKKVKVAGSDECWIWTASTRKGGYGNFQSESGNGAHRFSWFITYGPIPIGDWVLHKCDRPLCVNPRHLFLGSAQDNVEDRTSKGRSCRGENHPIGKLTEPQVREIRRRLGNESQSSLAREFGVSQPAIAAIQYRRAWGWLL